MREMVTTEEKAVDVGGNHGTSVPSAPRSDDEPNEIFKRMVINDKKQNQRLSVNLSKSNGIGSNSSSHVGKDASRTNVRFIVCTLALFALSVSQMSRMILNQTIKDMVDPSMNKKDGHSVSSDGSCPWPEEEMPLSSPSQQDTTTNPIFSTEVYQPPEDTVDDFISDITDEKPDNELTSWNDITDGPTSTGGPLEGANSTGIETIHEDRFLWTMKQQSYLLGGFFYGYSFFMIPGEFLRRFNTYKSF